jgi:4-aminobutyrate aminotransferase-like enzyme/Ser/Thr protein kinase RdoA (MazF antagonist)
LNFLKINSPQISVDKVRQMAKAVYGLEGRFTKLPTERDLNFRIENPSGVNAVFKIANRDEPADVIDGEIKALAHIAAADPELPVPRLIPTHTGLPTGIIEDDNGNTHIVHVLSWLEGNVIGDQALDQPRLFKLGATVARLGKSLRGFFHPTSGTRALLWDNAESPKLIEYVHYLKEPAHQDLARRVLEQFRDFTLPKLVKLRAQVIHGDMHPFNVLINRDGAISGIIDFGDLIHGALIQDLSNTIADFLEEEGDNNEIISALVAGYNSVTPLEAEELEVLQSLVEVRLLQSPIINAVRMAGGHAPADYLMAFGDKCFAMIEKLRSSNFLTWSDHPISRDDTNKANPPSMKEMIARRQRVMGDRLYVFYDPPIHMVRGEGVWLYDATGRAYLDCYNNVPHVGHAHPRVAEAISRQVRRLNTNTRYVTDQAIEYAERLTATTDPSLTSVIYVNSGSEANDIAWRMAKAWTKHKGGLCMDFAYHGITDAVDAFSPSNEPDAPIQSHIRTIPPPDDYRGPYRRGEADLGSRYAQLAAKAVHELAASDYGVAASMIDSAFMSNGMLAVPAGYVASICDEVRKAGGLFIADEVQSGFGRMGTAMWGHAHHGVVPDFITIGKPAGNGQPIGVIITRPEILEYFTRTAPFFSTFGGNNVSCAAGLAVLDVMRDENLIANAASTGAYFKSGLTGLMGKHEIIGDVRGTGLALGVELVLNRETRAPAPVETKRAVGLIRDEGVLVGSEGRLSNILKVRPPVVFTRQHADVAIAAIDRALSLVVRQAAG